MFFFFYSKLFNPTMKIIDKIERTLVFFIGGRSLINPWTVIDNTAGREEEVRSSPSLLAPRGTQLCQPVVIQNEPPYSQKDDHRHPSIRKKRKGRGTR